MGDKESTSTANYVGLNIFRYKTAEKMLLWVLSFPFPGQRTLQLQERRPTTWEKYNGAAALYV